MNILEMEDMVKGLPDQVLMQYAQFPDPQLPQFLALSEVQRRQDMRQRFQSQQQGMEPTVKDKILQGGIASVAPPQAPPQGMPMAQPQPMPQPSPQPPVAMSRGGMTPGGIASMQVGGPTPNLFAELRAAQAVGDVQRANQIRALIDAQRAQDPIYRLMDRFGGGQPPSPTSVVTQAAAPLAAPVEPSVSTPSVAAPAEPVPRPRFGREATAPKVLFPSSAQAPYATGIVAADQAMRDETGEPSVVPPAAMDTSATPAAPLSDRQTRLNEMMAGLPGVMEQMQGLTPQVPSFNVSDLQRFAPRPFDDSATMARREAFIEQLQGAGQTRREEDIAAAERYRTEAEAPIKAAQDEARRAAIASALMRLGSGLAAGDPAQGLASASQAVENIMTRAREQATAERRAVRQEFRQAEREATRGERDIGNTVFQIKAQQITSDENRQRELVRDQMQFSQWAFGQMRDQGKDQRQAYTDSIRLGAGLLQAVDTAIREETKNQRISQDQYNSITGALLRTVNERIEQMLPEDTDLSTPEGREDLNNIVISMVKSQLAGVGINSPSSDGVVTVTTPQELAALNSGDRYRGPDGIVRTKP
jgi:hypothetical protein